MKKIISRFLAEVLIGLLVLGPIYLTAILLLKVVGTLSALFEPVTALLPASAHFKFIAAIVFLILLCYWVGVLVKTQFGQHYQAKFERSVLEKIPGYTILRGFLRRLTGQGTDDSWQPALVETDDFALMPAFVIEVLADGRYSVFVPSVPTPFAGAVFVYQQERVHLVDLPFTRAINLITHWGQGAGEWVAAIKTAKGPRNESRLNSDS